MVRFFVFILFNLNVYISYSQDFDIVTYDEYKNLNGHNLNYVVKDGDNIYSVAKKTGTITNNIVLINNMSFPFNLTPGEKIRLPLPKFHVVKYGQSLSYISKIYNMSIGKIARINEIKKNTLLVPGTKLKISTLNENKITKIDESKKVRYSKKRISSVRIQKKIFENYKNKLPATFKYFLNPVNGIIVKKFNRFSKNPKIKTYDGLLYKAKIDTNIVASNNGQIVFVGMGPRGMGNMIVIKHSDNMESVYAYLPEKPKLMVGQFVKRGQKIGSINPVDGTYDAVLYFELRKNSNPINPEDYI